MEWNTFIVFIFLTKSVYNIWQVADPELWFSKSLEFRLAMRGPLTSTFPQIVSKNGLWMSKQGIYITIRVIEHAASTIDIRVQWCRQWACSNACFTLYFSLISRKPRWIQVWGVCSSNPTDDPPHNPSNNVHSLLKICGKASCHHTRSPTEEIDTKRIYIGGNKETRRLSNLQYSSLIDS